MLVPKVVGYSMGLAGQKTLVVEETVREGDTRWVTNPGSSQVSNYSCPKRSVRGEGIQKEVIEKG